MQWDKPLVTYPWMIAMVGNDHAAALLLNQIVYWFVQMKRPYYKFIQPPDGDHDAYKDGDSWCEELQMTYKQFIRARKVIATPVDRPLSILTGKYAQGGGLLPVCRIVAYWYKPREQMQHYIVNMSLLYAYQRMYTGEVRTLGCVDIASVETLDAIKQLSRPTQKGLSDPPKRDGQTHPKGHVLITENTPENTTENKNTTPDGDVQKNSLVGLALTIQETIKVPKGYAFKLAKIFTSGDYADEPVTADEFKGMVADFYKSASKDAKRAGLSKQETLLKRVYKYRLDQQKGSAVAEAATAERKTRLKIGKGKPDEKFTGIVKINPS